MNEEPYSFLQASGQFENLVLNNARAISRGVQLGNKDDFLEKLSDQFGQPTSQSKNFPFSKPNGLGRISKVKLNHLNLPLSLANAAL